MGHPAFWERFNAIPPNELSKFFASSFMGEDADGDFEIGYYPDGVGKYAPTIKINKYQYDGTNSDSVVVHQQLGASGSLSDANLGYDLLPFSLEVLERKCSERFVEPDAIKGVPWKIERSGIGAERRVKLSAGNLQQEIRQNVDRRGSLQFVYEIKNKHLL